LLILQGNSTHAGKREWYLDSILKEHFEECHSFWVVEIKVLAVPPCREAKTAVLTELISKTNAREMKWIVNIILKDLKMGISEKTIFSEFHPDAEDIFNVTCDLRAVCEKLNDRTKRFARQVGYTNSRRHKDGLPLYFGQ
jgi:hypothetical protein